VIAALPSPPEWEPSDELVRKWQTATYGVIEIGPSVRAITIAHLKRLRAAGLLREDLT
jgi:hypothetical protein